MKIEIDPKVDYAFKHVFGREESIRALISLADAVIEPVAGQRIISLDLLNPFNSREFSDVGCAGASLGLGRFGDDCTKSERARAVRITSENAVRHLYGFG